MDKIELIQKIEMASGIEYHAEDFKHVKDIIWNYYIDSGMFTEDELTLVTYLNGYNEKTLSDILYIRFGYRDLMQYLESELLNENTKTLNENLQDYYQDEILGKSFILRDLLNIEFPLNALTNELGEYLGYDEEDFTEEELDSRVIVTELYTDADGYIGAEIKFENEV